MLRMIAKRYDIKEVAAGMELAKSVVVNDGCFALGEGTVLTTSLIERLTLWGVDFLDIRLTVEENANEPVPLTLAQQCLSRDYNDTVLGVKKAFDTVRFFQQVPLKAMQEMAEAAIEKFIDKSGILNQLHLIHRQDDYTFHHSLNVAVLCGVIGRWLNYKDQEFKDLVLAGLLHDIGKTQIPLEILKKPAELTSLEMNTMRFHTTRGYNLIKELEVPQFILFAVLQHHERDDGSGYPLQVTGDKIHPVAKIVAVADTYDAMTSDRVYKKKVTPFQAVDAIVQDMYNKLDPNICSVFLNNVRDYFIGNIVELSDGLRAEVVYLGKFSSARPTVKTTAGDFIDLEKHKEIGIVKLISS